MASREAAKYGTHTIASDAKSVCTIGTPEINQKSGAAMKMSFKTPKCQYRIPSEYSHRCIAVSPRSARGFHFLMVWMLPRLHRARWTSSAEKLSGESPAAMRWGTKTERQPAA